MKSRWVLLQWMARCACVLALAFGAGAQAATDLPIDYMCDRESIFAADQLAPDLNWQTANGFEFEVAPGATCWMQFSMPVQEASAFNGTQFLRISQEQGQEIFLYDARGRLVAAASQDGRNIGSISSQTVAVFPVDQSTPRTLFGKVHSTNVLYSVHVSVDRNDHAGVISDGQRRDAISAALMAVLLTVGAFSAFYAVLTKEKPYMLFSLYALLTGLQVFGNYGVSLPFGINTANGVSLLAEPASNILLILTVLSLGRFAEHCLICSLWLGFSAWLSAIQIGWLLLLISAWVEPSWQSDWFYGFQYGATNVLSLAIVWGGIQSWRQGVPIGLALAIGAIPRAALWIGHSEAINTVVLGAWPTGLGFTEIAGVTGLLALPMMLLAGIAIRSRSAQKEVVRLARTDLLTGLPNRDWIIELGEAERARGINLAVLVLAVDRFKTIVEVLGFHAADTVMVQVTRRLCSIPGVTVGKSQETHFCLLWPDPFRLEGLRADLSRAFSQPIQVLDHWLDVSVSIGVAVDSGQSIVNLVRNAEVALDAADKSKLSWLRYEANLETSRPENLSMLSDLNAAIADNQFVLYLQPKVRMLDGTVHSAEALIRWRHPDKGMIAPNKFIPFAEQTGKIRAITLWVLKEAAKITKMMRDRGQPLLISVNVSALDLHDVDFVVRIFELIESLGALPGDIRLEVTESGVMDDPETSLVTLHALKNAGFSLSIDDFGTGYSSLAYLQRMPVAEVKIDRSFVHRVRSDSEGAALLDFIVSLGHRLGLTVVAEGAETSYEWYLLKELGCDYVQGWVAAQAMPLQEFLIWLDDHVPFEPATEKQQSNSWG
jgi:EAL domain-containing protein (putative c-di-GMP-specific phosphodiesterase class I)/GGDEF domain-containing protein